MASDDDASRKARAERLRKQIARVTKKPARGQPVPPPAEPPRPPSPREFVERRMRELRGPKP